MTQVNLKLGRLFQRGDTWHAEWRDPSRHPYKISRSLRTKNKREAETKLSILNADHLRGAYDPWRDRMPDDKLLVNEAVERFLDSRAHCSTKTVKTYRETLELFERGLTPNLMVRRVTPQQVKRFIERKSLSRTSHESYFRRLRTFFGWCVREGLVKESPMADMKKPRPADKVPEFLTRDEFDRLVAYIEGAEMNWLADVVRVAALTGLRRGELVNLQWSAVHLDKDLLVVQNTKDFSTKNGRERAVPIVPAVRAVLGRLAAQPQSKGDDYVFKGEGGGKLAGDYLSKRFRHYRKKVGLADNIRFHSLRHTCASWLVQGGMDLYKVKEILGHSSITVTQRYAHLAPQSLSEGMMRIFGDIE